MTNKVEFGLKTVAAGTYTVAADGTVTLGAPAAIPGAVSLALDPQSNEVVFYADDVKYYSSATNDGLTGTLNMALFPDAFKTAYLGYQTLADGGIALVKGAKKSAIYLMFEGDGDSEHRRHILYNVELGDVKRTYNTKGEKTDVDSEELPITVIGDNKTGITKVVYNEASTGYATLFTAPPVPTLPAA